MAIAKISRPRNAVKCINYILASNDHAGRKRDLVAVIASTIGRSALNAKRSLKAVGQLRPNLKRHLYQVSISVPPEERTLQNSEWARMGKSWCCGMGLENYLIVRHDDHIHIVASRIRLDGSAASDSHDYRRSELVLRRIERQFNLKRTQSSHLMDLEKRRFHRRTRSMSETFAITNDDGKSHKDYVRDSIDQALAEGCFASDIRMRLADFGIKMTVKNCSTSGPSALYAYRGRTYGPKSLGQGYSFESLRARIDRVAPKNHAVEEDAINPPWANLKSGEGRPRVSISYREQALKKLGEQRAKSKAILGDFKTSTLRSKPSIPPTDHDSLRSGSSPPDGKR